LALGRNEPVLGLILVALLAVGCSGPSGPSRFTPETLRPRSPRTVAAVELRTALPAAHESRLAAYRGKQVFESRLIEDVTAAGLLSPEADLELQVTIVAFRFRTGATSIWVGSMAGADRITVDVDVMQNDRSLGSFSTGTSSIKGGLLMPSSGARLRNLTYSLSERIVREFAEMPLTEPEEPRATGHVPQPPDAATNEIEERLRKLRGLYDDGLINQDEYEAKRRAILNDL
jgi:hypothetical protein